MKRILVSATAILAATLHAPAFTLTLRDEPAFAQLMQTPANGDPVAELKKHLATNGATKNLAWTDLKYDVRKSDSLVSPFIGTIQVNAAVPGNEEATLAYSVILAYGDGGWRIANLRCSMGGFPAKNYTAEDDPKIYYAVFCKQYGF